MKFLSSRAKLTTHSVSFVYNYSDFRGDHEALLVKHFDVHFYVTNWRTFRLMFKYKIEKVDPNAITSYLIDYVIGCKTFGDYTVLTIEINELDSGWRWLIKGDELLVNLLPLYEEIKHGNYNLLILVAIINATINEGHEDNNISIDPLYNRLSPLSTAQQFLIETIDFTLKS